MGLFNEQLSEKGWEWFPSPGWTVESIGVCRRLYCGKSAVAFLMRPHSYMGRQSMVSWRYCNKHLYGNEIRGGRVMGLCDPESPFALEHRSS